MTYFLWLGLFLVLGAVGFSLRRRGGLVGPGLMAVGAVGLGATLTWRVYAFFHAGRPPPADRLHAAVAYFMGYEVMGELRGLSGPICLVLAEETSANRDTLDALFNTFARVLAPLPGIQPKEAPLRVKPALVRAGQVPRAEFERALAEVPNALAYVSFVGVPLECDQLALFGRTNAAPLYVFDPTGGQTWRAALKAGKIRRVIVPRLDAEANGGPPPAGPPDEIFRQHYLMVTPETADRVAAQLERAGRRPR